MIRDAENNSAADQKRRGVVEARNELEGLIHSVNKSFAEHGEKLDEATKSEIQAAIDDAKSAVGSEDAELLKTKTSALSNAALKIGQSMYKKDEKAQGDASASSETDNTASEAEYKEKDDSSKGSK
jgi:molecular chaperone DnaK